MPGTDTTSPGRGVTDGGQSAGDTGESVLVLADTIDGDAGDYCAERIASRPGSASSKVLLVALDETPDDRFDAVVRRGIGEPTDVGIVCCESTRGATATRSAGGPGLGHGPWIATVASPGDLAGLGARIEEALSAWADDPEPVELCFHSLTTLCQYVDERAAFRFCHAVTRHLDAAGAGSHFHLDPSAVDERTVATLSALFDRVEDRT